MAEKLDDIDKQIDRELYNLSLDEQSTSDADSVADQSLPDSPTKDNYADVLGEYLHLMNKTHSDLDVLHNQSRDFLKVTEKAMLDTSLVKKLKDGLDSEATPKDEDTVMATSASTLHSHCELSKKDEQNSVSPINKKPLMQHTVPYPAKLPSLQVSQDNYDQSIQTKVILQHLDAERKEKEELLAEEQRNVNEKLQAMEKEQLRCLEKAKKVEAQLKEEKIQKQIKAAVILQAFWRRFRVWSTYHPKLKLLKELRLRKSSEEKLKQAERLKERCRAAVMIQKYWRGYRIWLTYQPKLKLLKELRLRRIAEEKFKLAEEFKEKSKAATTIQKYWRGYKVWSAYYQKLKILKEEQLRKLLNEKAKQLNELAGAATVLQKHWRRCKVQRLYGMKLKELKQKRILAKLKKINEKRRRYYSVSTEGKVLLSANDNSVVNSETTTTGLTSKSAENFVDQKSIKKADATKRPTETEVLKNASGNVSDNVAMKDDASEPVIPQNSIPITNSNADAEDGEGTSKENVTNISGVIKLCRSPVRMNDTIKEEIHKLLKEEESRTIKVESIEKSTKSLKIQSNFEAGLLNLHSPDGQSFAGRRSSASPVSGNTLSTSSSSTIFMSPPVSKTVSKTSEVLQESDEDEDDDDNVSKELKMLNAIVASKHEEEFVAKKSRERMLKAYSVEKSNVAAFGGTKKSLIDYATAEMSPMVWHELIEERRKRWLVNHSLWKSGDAPLLMQKFRRLPTIKKYYNEQTRNTVSHSSQCIKKPLSEFQLLSASPRGTKLDQVTQVNVFKAKHEVDLSCLAKCPGLISLNLTKCIIPSLAGFIGNDQLIEICAQSNSSDSMDCSGLSNLMFLDVACNRLSSLQGLKDTQQLLEINLSENRLTRIAYLENCKSLEKLILDGNLLVNSEGLLPLPNLQYLSLVGNHLTKLDSIDNCSLLQYCYLQENNIQEFPKVLNSPLLREIHLEQNNLDNVEAFSSAFLPLLEVLNLSGNCISHLEPMSTFVMLHTLNVSNNCINDLSEFLQSLKSCYEIKSLIVDGNPIIEEANFKSSVKKILPKLKYLGEEEIINQGRSITVPENSFVEFCRKQITEQNKMTNKHLKEIERLNNFEDDSPGSVVELLRTKFYHSKERCILLTEHLWQHEYYETDKAKELLCQRISLEQSKAAITIQAIWRGQRVRKWLKTNSPRYLAAVCLQSLWRGYCVRKKLWSQLVWMHVKKAKRETMHKAATRIQACYRGYRLRKRLKAILEQAKYTDDEGGSDDFDYSQDIVIHELDENIFNSCLKSPDIDESLQERDVNLPTTSTLPLQQENQIHTTSQPSGPLKSTNCNDDILKPDELPNMSGDSYKTRNTLLDNVSTQSFEETLYLGSSKPMESLNSSNGSCNNEKIVNAVNETAECNDQQAVESEITKIAQEWGFKDIATAEMMMKRAKKHRQPHANTIKAKKMTDPKVRLAQFKAKQQEPVAVKCVHCRARKKKEYFQSQQVTTPTPSPNYKEKKDFVYRWVDNQNLFHETLELTKSAKPSVGKLLSREKSQQSLKQPSEVINETSTSLPYMEPHVLAGHVPRLVTSEMQNELARHSSVGANDKAKMIPQHLYNKVKSSSSPDMFEIQDSKKKPHR